jgi:hypothetical protein
MLSSSKFLVTNSGGLSLKLYGVRIGGTFPKTNEHRKKSELAAKLNKSIIGSGQFLPEGPGYKQKIKNAIIMLWASANVYKHKWRPVNIPFFF